MKIKKEPLMTALPEGKLVYELRTKRDNLLEKYSGTKRSSSKQQKGVYLLDKQWKFLDELAEEEGKSRNQVLRDILNKYLEQHNQ
jgi:hypothetical protein